MYWRRTQVVVGGHGDETGLPFLGLVWVVWMGRQFVLQLDFFLWLIRKLSFCLGDLHSHRQLQSR